MINETKVKNLLTKDGTHYQKLGNLEYLVGTNYGVYVLPMSSHKVLDALKEMGIDIDLDGPQSTDPKRVFPDGALTRPLEAKPGAELTLTTQCKIHNSSPIGRGGFEATCSQVLISEDNDKYLVNRLLLKPLLTDNVRLDRDIQLRLCGNGIGIYRHNSDQCHGVLMPINPFFTDVDLFELDE